MESRRQLDPAGGAGIRPRGIFPLIFLTLGFVSWLGAADDLAQFANIAAIRQAFDEQRWQQVVEQAQALSHQSAEIDYYYGVALAQLGRLDESRTALLRGQRFRPQEERFAIELGGVAFKQKRYSEASRWLRRALRLNPGDTYVADFLATVYFLQGNLDAALKYWNRIDKPQIESVRVEPALRPHLVEHLLRNLPVQPADRVAVRRNIQSQDGHREALVAGLDIRSAALPGVEGHLLAVRFVLRERDRLHIHAGSGIFIDLGVGDRQHLHASTTPTGCRIRTSKTWWPTW